MTAAQRLALRQAESAPLLKSFGHWIEQARLQALPKSPLAEALGYVRNQWQALNVYLTDGDLSIDNNTAERALRGTAIGRKNWLFFGSETGGRTAAHPHQLDRDLPAAGHQSVVVLKGCAEPHSNLSGRATSHPLARRLGQIASRVDRGNPTQLKRAANPITHTKRTPPQTCASPGIYRRFFAGACSSR